MIKFNNSDIIDWNFDDSNIIKVYHNGAVVFYKFDSEQGGYKVCYAVVDDITKYSETEFEDVYDKATEKWYKLNNLNQYEEYGVYGSGRTSCEGSASRLPQGYTEVEYIENTSTAYINTEVLLYDSTTNSYNIQCKCYFQPYGNDLEYLFGTEGTSSPYVGVTFRYYRRNILYSSSPDNVSWTHIDNGDGTSGVTASCASTTATNGNNPLTLFCGLWSTGPWRNGRGKIYSFKVTKNNTLVRDLVPAKRDSDDKYGMYDLVTNAFYLSPNNVDFSGGEPVTPTDCVTTYNGKLTIDDGYEYEWNGSSWVNVGEVSGSSVVEYIERNSTHSGYLPLGEYFTENTVIKIDFQMTQAKGNAIIGDYGSNDNDDWRVFLNYNSSVNNWLVYDFINSRNYYDTGDWSKRFHLEIGNYYIKDLNTDTYLVNATRKTSFTRPNQMYLFHMEGSQVTNNIDYGKIYSVKIYQNDTLVKDFAPWTDGNGNYGLYDNVSSSVTQSIGLMTGYSISVEVYPKYYSEKSEPLDNLTFSTMEDAQAYAEANCVYDGMHATIDGDRYYFDSTDENGWVKVLEYYKFEDVTPSGGSGWTISGSATYNPDSSYYDDFDLETTSTSNVTKIAKVTIYGYDKFTYYLRTSGYSNFCYAVATNIDEVSTPPSTMGYSSSSAITNTYYWNKSPKSAVNLSNYRRVTYNNLDKTVEHTFYVYFYGRTYSSYVGNATILIPKEQTNENWEQVTFSASSNVASTTKNLYIDGNNSTSGGTDRFYYRWMLGLPSGSHTSYTNYSNYSYCPNVTSSTFTSVAGEQRQVNFTYNNTSNKTLSFRLTDGSNVLTPSDTVYFNMTYYNSCGVSSSSNNVTFPRSQSVKVGGRFRFANSSNRHYIYGYSPNISLNTDYYVDNYQSTFDITYTKLSDEAVTITYTTYDPSDTEIPSFKTDITYPYNGGTTSSTTLTSYAVPYTYSYKVSQTNDKFSADSQSYAAGQSSRTITFTLYPNNREFATVADMEAYAYAWEGMKAKVGDTNYEYKNGEWVEKQHSLPDVPFVLNYNARQYNASTHTIPYTEGALNAINAVITGTTANIIDHSSDGYIELTGSTSTAIRALVGTTNFSRSSSSPNITIICKAYTPGSSTEGNILSNRKESYNWMYRHKSSILAFHGTSEQGSIAVSNTEPNTCSVRVNSSRLLTYNNWTKNTTSTYSNFSYGSNSNGGALFSGYYSSSGEMWKGVFYWIYMSLNTLTDEQVQQVIDYNENL